MTTHPIIRVLISDANEQSGSKLSLLINATDGLSCTGVLSDSAKAGIKITGEQPGVFFIKMNGAPENGNSHNEAIRNLKILCPCTMVLVQMDADEVSLEMLQSLCCCGVTGFLQRNAGDEQIVKAIKIMDGHGSYLAREFTGIYVKMESAIISHSDLPEIPLTKREKEVCDLLKIGMPYKLIAIELGVTINTICSHIAHIYKKLKVHSKTEAANRLQKHKKEQKEE